MDWPFDGVLTGTESRKASGSSLIVGGSWLAEGVELSVESAVASGAGAGLFVSISEAGEAPVISLFSEAMRNIYG